MKTILITGADGFIAKHFVRKYQHEYKITSIAFREDPELESMETTVRYIDLSQDLDYSFLPQKIDAIIHMAQSDHYRFFPDRAIDMFNVNIKSTIQLLDYARQASARAFVYSSSGSVYNYGDAAFREDEKFSSQSSLGFYPKTKLCAEILSNAYQEFMNIFMLRFFFVYGQNQKKDMLFPRLVQSVQDRKPIILDGDEGFLCNPIHVEDVVKFVEKSLHLIDSNTINIGGKHEYSLKSICDIIGSITKKDVIYEQRKNFLPMHLVGNTEKMLKILGQPEISLEDGIQTIV